MKYKLIVSHNAHEFELAINEALQEGWNLVSDGLSIIAPSEYFADVTYYREMVRP